jgi:hypothetical protein
MNEASTEPCEFFALCSCFLNEPVADHHRKAGGHHLGAGSSNSVLTTPYACKFVSGADKPRKMTSESLDEAADAELAKVQRWGGPTQVNGGCVLVEPYKMLSLLTGEQAA